MTSPPTPSYVIPLEHIANRLGVCERNLARKLREAVHVDQQRPKTPSELDGREWELIHERHSSAAKHFDEEPRLPIARSAPVTPLNKKTLLNPKRARSSSYGATAEGENVFTRLKLFSRIESLEAMHIGGTESTSIETPFVAKDNNSRCAVLTVAKKGDSVLEANKSINIQTTEETSMDSRHHLRKSVHFSEDIIKHVSVVHESETRVLMQVEYSRPLWIWIAALVAYFGFAICWSLIAKIAYTSTLPNTTVAASMMAFTAVTTVFCAAGLLVFCLLSVLFVRLGRKDLINIRKPKLRTRFIAAVVAGGIARLCFLLALMIALSSTFIFIFVTLPVIFLFGYMVLHWRSITLLDTIGTVLVWGGIIVVFIGELEVERDISQGWRCAAFATAIISAISEAISRLYQKKIRPNFSPRVVLCSSVWCTALLIVVASISYNLSVQSSSPLLGEFSSGDWSTCVGAAIAMLLSLVLQFMISLYFDVISSAAGTTLCAPLVMMFFRTFNLPHVKQGFQYGATIPVIVGCVMLVFSGWVHRRRVELPINITLVAEPMPTQQTSCET